MFPARSTIDTAESGSWRAAALSRAPSARAEHRLVDIAAGKNHDDGLSPRSRSAPGEQRRQRHRPARLDHQLQFAKRIGDRGQHLASSTDDRLAPRSAG